MSNTVLVVAAVVDTRQLTLYTTTGDKVYIPQGDPRLAKIIEYITPILSRGQGSMALVDLSVNMVDNTYQAYEKQTGGLVRIFRVAKKALSGLFGSPEVSTPEYVDPMVVGEVPERVELTDKGRVMASAVRQILAHAQTVPVSDPNFSEKSDTEESTMVAVVGDQVIDNIEALKPQMARAVSIGSSKGLDTFMQRLAAVAGERRHSAQDLLKFLEKGDLPIADDGSIIIYKILRRRGEGYVDCHTQRVTQRVGSYVCVNAELVDPDRRVECSNGLHVARRGYLGNFSGDVCVLAKVAPEDVIAVPEYDLNKMRVCGYHILFELSDNAFRTLQSNRPFTDNDEARILLGRAIAGDHPAPIEDVRITQQYGGGLVITPRTGTKETPAPVVVPAEALSDDEVEQLAPPVDPKAVSKQVAEVKAEVVLTRAQKAQALYQTWLTSGSETDKAALFSFKKLAKVSWSKLSLPDLA